MTPLQAADTPNMDFIAKHGKCGMAKTVPMISRREAMLRIFP